MTLDEVKCRHDIRSSQRRPRNCDVTSALSTDVSYMRQLVKPNWCHKASPNLAIARVKSTRKYLKIYLDILFNYHPYNNYFARCSERKSNSPWKSFSQSLHTRDHRDTTCRYGKTGIVFKETAAPFPAGKFTRRHYLVAIKFIRRSVRAEFIFDAEPGAVHHRLKSTRRSQTQALRAARFESMHAYVRT